MTFPEREKNYIKKNITSQATLLANNSFTKAIYSLLIMPMSNTQMH